MVLLMEGKVRKFGLKSRIEKTKVATHIWLVCKTVNNTFSIKFLLKKNRKARFALKIGLISVKNGMV